MTLRRPVWALYALVVGLDRVHARKRGGEAIEPGVANGGDPVGPGIHRLEEVVARTVAERGVRDPHVDHSRLRSGREQVEKQAKLPLAAS